MERLEYHEGETFHWGGYPVTIAHARGGKLVAFVGSGESETGEDTKRLARLLRAKLDKALRKEDTAGN